MMQNKFNATICLRNVVKKYNTITAVDNISFEAKNGEIIALLGPNGAGKSTLMNMISGFISPTNGKIYVNDLDVAGEDIEIKKNIGFLSEGAPMYSDMSVKIFLQYMIALKLNLEENENCSAGDIKKIYCEELERVAHVAKIGDVLSQKIETLSKGYLRRVGFAQSIIGNPPILLLDEPTDGLDPNQKNHMRSLIDNMGKNKIIIISTHLLEEAETIANRIILINKGKIIVDGNLKDILSFAKCKNLNTAFKKLTCEEIGDE